MAEKKKKNNKANGSRTRERASTKRNKAKILDVLRETGDFVTTACNKVGISRYTFYEWLKNDEDFNAEYEAIRDHHVDLVEGELYSNIFEAERNSDRIRAAEIYLKARGKSRGYGVEKREQQHEGELNVKNTGEVILYLPDNGRSSPDEK